MNPLNAEALEKVRGLCPDLKIKPILCAYKHFEVVTAKLFSEGANKKSGPLELTATSFGLKRPTPAAAKAKPTASEAKPAAAPTALAAPKSDESSGGFVAPPPPPMPVLDSGVRSSEEVSVAGEKADAMIDSVFGLKVEDVVGGE